eukprot:1149801-Pelagomonas_calceolata.AAC.12
MQAVSAERDALATELAAVGEDLEALVKENQVGGIRASQVQTWGSCEALFRTQGESGGGDICAH